jgi:hypothetical protein
MNDSFSLSFQSFFVSFDYFTFCFRHFFQAMHSKRYATDMEEKFRMKIFMENKQRVARHNTKFAAGIHPFQMGLNKYSDMVSQTFLAR